MQEVAAGGLFDPLHRWLDERMAVNESHGFFRPYDKDRKGVAPERWHLSYAPRSVSCAQRCEATLLAACWGAVSMARAGVDTAVADFFVCIGALPLLDFGGARNADGQGFAVFGRVVSGMDVAKKIQASPVREGSQTLQPPVTIVSARRK